MYFLKKWITTCFCFDINDIFSQLKWIYIKVVLKFLNCLLCEERKPKLELAMISFCDAPQIKIFSLLNYLPMFMPRPKSRWNHLTNRNNHNIVTFSKVIWGHVRGLGNLFCFTSFLSSKVHWNNINPLSLFVLVTNFKYISLVPLNHRPDNKHLKSNFSENPVLRIRNLTAE